ncbi:DUF2235 domain-containing protein [Duganella sp. CY15W]|uniref:T6SS phospholipase effector Tle1-like catalytic domain-containing protein n=1 Tax=Duganella sp. CY15W TaxID=2692172 RepID=UPI00136D5679|nr:DUF2235 domain-containing protein [Duganella sp. CY15W]MYM27040.1 DUF2235 domain-containing protein [Duganella sp. CY15W]
MIASTPATAPYPVDVFLKPSSKERSSIAMVVCSTATELPCRIPVRVGLFFDGTNNNLGRDRDGKRVGVINEKTKKPSDIPTVRLKPEDCSHSNVARLFEAFPRTKQKSGYFPYYIAGVGTPFPEIGELTETDDGKAFAKGGQARIIWGLFQILNSICLTLDQQVMYEDDEAGKLSQNYGNEVGRVERDVENKQNHRMTHREWFEPHLKNLQAKLASRPKPTIPSLTVSVFGFSRGAAEATAFCHFFAELLDNDRLVGIPVSIDFLGVFDIVATVGMSDSAGRTTIIPRAFFDGHWAWANRILRPLPGCVKAGRHYIAAHEQRMNFPLTQIRSNGGDFVEVFFPGVHSDVGGGYAPGEYGKGRGAQSAMLSQIPLAYMYKAAREAGVPLKPFSELEARDQQDFLVSAQLASAWDAYTGTLGKHGSFLIKHMELYYRWRAARLTSLENTDSFKASSPQAQEDMRSSNNMLRGDLDALTVRKPMQGPRQGGNNEPFRPSDLSRINQWQYYRAQNFVPLDKWETWALGVFEKHESLPAEVMRFFDDYVHDSLAGFYLAGAVTEFDKRVAVANARSKSEWRRSDFDKKVLALADKVEAAQKKANDQVPLTKEEQALVDESKTGTPFPIMTDKDTADMRSALITTQTATRREGGGYLLRRSFYPQEGFFIRESINEEELEKMPTGPEVPEKISSNTVTYEYIWSDNLIGDLAINTEAPARGREERMVA